MFNWIKKKFKKEDNNEIKDELKISDENLEEGKENINNDSNILSEMATIEEKESKIESNPMIVEKTEQDKEQVDNLFNEKHDSVKDKQDNVDKSEKIVSSEKHSYIQETEKKQKPIQEKDKEKDENKLKEEKPEEKGMFKRLFDGLNKTRKNLVYQVNSVFSSNEINDEFYDELEEVLVMSDIGARTTMTIIDRLRDRLVEENIHQASVAKETLKAVMLEVLNENVKSNVLNLEPLPAIVMLVGVNGVGKTTTVGKLAYQFKQEGMSVSIIAADTFRAAAIDQLEVWGERANVKVITQKEGADPASVVFDGLDYSIKNNIDITIIDTAGRLHNKVNLMNELNKIKRIIDRKMPEATMEIIMALDATTGQNALLQLNEFKSAANVTGVALTKLDGTAKGGVIIPIQHEEGIPIKIIGVGESIYDLQPFDPELFVNAIFEENQ